MDKPVLIIEAPELDDDGAASVYHFLQELVLAFESHYYAQLVRQERNRQVPDPDWQSDQNDEEREEPFNDEIPF